MHLRILKADNIVKTRGVAICYAPQSDVVRKRLDMIDQWRDRPEFQVFKDNIGFKRDLENIASWVAINDLEYAAYPCLNHWLLKEAERHERESMVETEIEKLFGAHVAGRDAQTATLLGVIRSCMKVMPTPLLQPKSALACWFAKVRLTDLLISEQKALKQDDSYESNTQGIVKRLEACYPWTKDWNQLTFADEISSNERVRIISMLDTCGRGISIKRHPEFMATAKRLAGHPAGSRVLAGVADLYHGIYALNTKASLHPHPDFIFTTLLLDLEAASQAKPALSKAEIKSIIDQHMRQLEQVALAQRREADDQTLQLLFDGNLVLSEAYALEAAQALGFLYKKEIQAAWNANRVPPSQTSPSPSPIANTGRGRGGRQPKGSAATAGRGRGATNAQATATSTTSKDDAAARENWSLDQYVDWINGSTTRKAASATDATQAAADYNKRMKESRDGHRNALAKLAPSQATLLMPEEAYKMTEAEAQEIIQAGLRKTVRFISDEISDVKTLTAHPTLHIDLALLADCAKKLDDLKKQKLLDELNARQVFEEVWTQLEHIRSTIVEQKESEQVYRDFEAALWKALKEEGIQVGKTIGGNVSLAAPDPLAYWQRIAKDYHNRYLAVASDCIGANAEDRDHALAFYVTLGSCTPGAAFCISVHRWRRKAGTSALPSKAQSLAMDTEHWTDTLVPCCVLHVRGTAASPKVGSKVH